MRWRFRWASVRGLRGGSWERFVCIKKDVTGDSLRLSKHSETLSLLSKSAWLVNSGCQEGTRTGRHKEEDNDENLHGKRILVTGVSAGLGVETARSLAAHGAQVVGAARDLTKAKAATEQVRKDAAANGGSFELIGLD